MSLQVNSTSVSAVNYRGPVGYSVVGTPTISAGVVSNTTSSNYVRIEESFNGINSDFELSVKFTTGTLTALATVIGFQGTDTKLAIEANKKLVFLLGGVDAGGDTSNVNIRPSESYYLDDNTTYYVVVKKTDTTLRIAISTDKTNWTENTKDIPDTVVSMKVPTQVRFGAANAFSGGAYDMNETYIKVNGKLWFWQPREVTKLQYNGTDVWTAGS